MLVNVVKANCSVKSLHLAGIFALKMDGEHVTLLVVVKKVSDASSVKLWPLPPTYVQAFVNKSCLLQPLVDVNPIYIDCSISAPLVISQHLGR